jgi:two-component system, cell cycle sensor histidine kinase and response regulator CckA
MFDQNPHPMWVYDETTLRFLAVNQAAIDHYGYSQEEFLSMTLRDIRPEEDVPNLLEFVREDELSYATDAGIWRHRTKDGRVIFVEILSRQLNFENHSASLVLAMDVSDRLRAEEALATSEEKYREFLENVSFGIYRSAPDGTFLDVNPALVSMLGYESKAELVRCNLNTDIYEKPEERAAILSRCGPYNRITGTIANFKKKGGAIITVSLDGKEIHKDGQVSHYEVIVEDITERRLLEDQLRQAQKMEAIGRLAGGVAHDFNNALGVITGYSELLQFKLRDDATLHKHASEILKAGMKAASLTQQLLAFSRKQNLRPQVLDLNSIVRDIEKMLRRLIGENIDLVHVSAPDLAKVMADPSQIEQVLMNLVVNARDAMPHGGKLRIETTNTEVDESLTRRHKYLAPGKYVVLSVTDSGCGMDEKVMSQIFEPFFTTKALGKGTGLGLSTVYGIVKQSGGYITVDSAPNRGTRFSIYLPPTNRIAKTTATTDIAPPIPLGSETILLVEDEAALRELACSTLSAGGYTVLSAGSAESAITIAQRHGSRIHLVLTDVMLPGISGPNLVESLRISFPQIKTIFMSGYTDELLGEHGMLSPEIVVLQKPFSNKTLLTKMRELLDS